MQVTESIVQYIEEHLKGPDACVQFRRNELAALLGCAPSQITYVIASHYTVGRGYLVESRRGGGGFVRITRTQMPLKAMETQQEKSLSFVSAQLLVQEYQRRHILAPQTAAVILAAISDQALSQVPGDVRGQVRVHILQCMLLAGLGDHS